MPLGTFEHTLFSKTLRKLHRSIFYTNDGPNQLLFDISTEVALTNFDLLPHMRENGPESKSIDGFMAKSGHVGPILEESATFPFLASANQK